MPKKRGAPKKDAENKKYPRPFMLPYLLDLYLEECRNKNINISNMAEDLFYKHDAGFKKFLKEQK